MTSHCSCNYEHNPNLSQEKINLSTTHENNALECLENVHFFPHNESRMHPDATKYLKIDDVESEEDGTSLNMLLVDGNQVDFDECEDESTLMERVWLLSKPPLMKKQSCVVSARKVQVIREELFLNTKCISTVNEDLRSRIKRNLNLKRCRKKSVEYVPVEGISFLENNDSKNILPPCARNFSEFL